MKSITKIAIVGKGAIGLSFYKLLNNKLTNCSLIGKKQRIPRSELYILCVKAKDVEVCLKTLVLNQNSIVMICCNGIISDESWLSEYAKQANLIRVAILYGAVKKGNSVRIFGTPRLAMASFNSLLDIQPLKSLLELSGFETRTGESVFQIEWQKLPVNLLVNSVCTLLNRQNAELAKNPIARDYARGMLNEFGDLSRKVGIKIYTFMQILNGVREYGANTNSTLIDVRSGRKTERDYIFGKVLSFARQNKVKSPKLWAADVLLRSLEIT